MPSHAATHGEPRRLGARCVRLLVRFCFAVGAWFVLSESAMRMLDIGPRPMLPLELGAYRLAENPAMRYEFVPGFTGRREQADEDPERINEAGFRDRSHSRKKAPSITRIAVLGDSVVAGLGIARQADTFPSSLERLLNGHAQEARFEVLNFGVGGYDTTQEVAILEERGLDYEPDIVLLTFCMNDFWQNSDGGLYARLLEKNRSDTQGATVVSPTSTWILQHSRLAFFLYCLLGSAGPHTTRSEDALLTTYSETHVAEALRRLRRLQQERGFRCVIVVVPGFRGSFEDYTYRETHERLAAVNKENAGLPIIDLLEDFAGSGEEPAKLASDTLHPNPQGARLLAEFLEERLLKQYPDLLRQD